MINKTILMTSIIAMTFLIGITANYAIAADVEVVIGEITAFNIPDLHFWTLSDTDGTSTLEVTLVCGNTDDTSTTLDPELTVNSPTFSRTDDDSFTPCDEFPSSIVNFGPGEVEDGCWVTQSSDSLFGPGFDTIGPYTLTLELSGPGDITPLETDNGFDCVIECPGGFELVGNECLPIELCEAQQLACVVPFANAQLNCEVQSFHDWMNDPNPDVIAQQVFLQDPFCINVNWDGICVGEYFDICIGLAQGEFETCLDETPCEEPLASIHVLKFHDLNGDGIQDLPEEEGIPGWGVEIDCNDNNDVETVTDEDGLVWFEELLAPDQCEVSEETRDGWAHTTEPVVEVELNPGDEIIVEFGNVQVITASKSWTHTDYTWEGNTETDDVLADELPTDDQGNFVAFAQVHKNGKYTGTNPGAMYALTTIEVLADIDGLWVEEIYGECTNPDGAADTDDGILQFVSKKLTRNVKVAIADSNDDVTELTDDLYNDVGGSIDATLEEANVHIEQPIEAGSTVYVLVKFKDNPSNIEVDDGEVDVMCDNVENVSADIFDQTVTVSVDASLRITNQE